MKYSSTAPSSDVQNPGVMRQSLKPHYALLGITVIAAVVRFHYLDRESLWFDESASVSFARLAWGNLWKVVSRLEANMALYYGLLHIWIRFSDSEFAVRALSVVAGVLTVPLVYAIGKRMFNSKVGLVSAVLLTTNAFHIKYSQEARGYTLVVLLVTLSGLFFIRGVQDHSRNDWIGYVLASTLAVYAHFFGIFVLAAQWTSLILLRPRDVPWSKLLISISLIIILLLPLAIFVLTRDNGQLAWVAKPSIYDIYGLLDSLIGGGRPLLLAYFICCFVTLLLAIRAWVHSRRCFDAWRYGFLLSWLFVPVLTAFAISLRKPIFVDRFFIICLPALVLLAAIGVCRIRQRWIFAASLVVLLLLSARKIPLHASKLEKEDWRGATAYVVSHASPTDGILFYVSYGRLGFDYYAGRLSPLGHEGEIVFPERVDFDPAAKLDPSDSLLASLPHRYERVWLLVRFNERDPELQRRDRSIEAILASEYPREIEKRFKGMRVLQYSRGDRVVDP
jgi:mannosyltransferase